MGARLRRLLVVVLALFGLLAVNGAYLGGITALEWASGRGLQDYFYQLMFLAHLALGLLLLLPAVLFGALHLRNAHSRPNRNAVRAGLALYSSALVLLASGVVLTRLGGFEVRDPDLRAMAYWAHVVTPLLVAWLFVLHRLAGRPIRWRVGLVWGTAALALPVVFLVARSPEPGGDTLATEHYAGDAFRPSLAQTQSGELIPARALMMDDYCRECHEDSHAQWSHSAHRFSSFNNPAYRFSVRELRKVTLERDGSTTATRFCAGCHDLVPLFSGALDDPDYDDEHDPTASAGITCTGCHAITAVNSPRGNASYTIAAPEHYPFAYSTNPVLAWINRQLVKAKPAFHKRTFLKPLHRTPELCGTCHKVFLPRAINDYKWLRGQDHYDAYLLSGVSGHGASSFYYPPRAVDRCAECHMPLVASHDFGAAHYDGSESLAIHSHQFPGANTALPYLLGLPEEVVQAHRTYLAKALRVDLFGIKEGGAITGELSAPLRPRLPRLIPGRSYLLETVIRTLGVGHTFTQGTADSNQVWVELSVRDGERVIGHSGGVDAEGRVDPWSHFINAYVLDRDGRRIDRRNGQDIYTTLYNHQIPPGAADVVHFRLDLPEDARGPLRVEVQVKYRKFDSTYLRLIQGDAYRGNHLPVTVLASDRIVLPVAGGPEAPPAPASRVAAWERWNDYGIGLLRKPGNGELRQAETAFLRVEALGRGDGPLNLARAYLREGRLQEAAAALRRAAEHPHPPPAWVTTWLSALVDKQNGYLDRAIADLRRIANTDFLEARRRGFDFSRDYRVLGELGQTLVERAKRERGEARREARLAYLDAARGWFEKVLAEDPENVNAHFNLALLYRLRGEPGLAEEHRRLHERYRPDDNAAGRVIAEHRRRNPAADHAAEAVVIYPLHRPAMEARVAEAD